VLRNSEATGSGEVVPHKGEIDGGNNMDWTSGGGLRSRG
jgi:hypothetical protein